MPESSTPGAPRGAVSADDRRRANLSASARRGSGVSNTPAPPLESGSSYGAEFEVDLDADEPSSAEDDAAEPSSSSARSRARRTPAIPAPSLEHLPDEERKKEMDKYMRQLNNIAVKKSREKRKEKVEAAAAQATNNRKLTRLIDVGQVEGGIRQAMKVGDTFATKDHFIQESMGIAEYLSLTINCEVNSKFRVKVVPEAHHGVGPVSFMFDASFNSKRMLWVVTTSVCDGTRGSGPMALDGEVIDHVWRKGHKRTAYSDKILAAHIEEIMRAHPGEERKKLVAAFKPYLRYPEHIEAHQWTRVRKAAVISVWGLPNDNIQKLDSLKAEMEKHGHMLDYTSIGGEAMVGTVFSVWKSEHERNRKRAAKIPVASRSAEQEKNLAPWPQTRLEFLEAHKDMLEKIRSGGLCYVDFVAVSFKFETDRFPLLLSLINVDAAHGSYNLDTYNLFSLVGFSANLHVVPLMYFYICGTESALTWSRAWQYAYEFMHGLDSRITVGSDGEKGLRKAMTEVFGSECPKSSACSHHRSCRLKQRFGKAVVSVFYELMNCKTVPAIAAKKQGASFQDLPQKAKDALNELPDDMQYPAAVVQAGGKSYGKHASTGVEANNGAVKDMRCIDITNSIVMLGRREARVYNQMAHNANTATGYATPSASARLADVVPSGDATLVPIESTAAYKKYHVSCANGIIYKVRIAIPDLSDPNYSYFLDDGGENCSCGVPARDLFPCEHMAQVAFQYALQDEHLVPFELSNAHWREQYPEGIVANVPSMADVNASDVPRNELLRIPVTAPPKRGRPSTKRKMNAMEIIAKRVRSQNGT